VFSIDFDYFLESESETGTEMTWKNFTETGTEMIPKTRMSPKDGARNPRCMADIW